MVGLKWEQGLEPTWRAKKEGTLLDKRNVVPVQ
jgi:hypothetical protein